MCKIFKTDSKDYASLVLRVALGIFIFAHGGQKLFGLFGGNGFEATMGFFTTSLGLPYIVALLVILGEGLGSIALILGFFTRFMAASIMIILVGAVYLVHLKNGFYDFELHFLAIAISIALILKGGGAWAMDSILEKMTNKK